MNGVHSPYTAKTTHEARVCELRGLVAPVRIGGFLAALATLCLLGATVPADGADHAASQPASQPAEQGGPMIPGHPTKVEGPKSGALRVRVSQGTKDAPAIGNDPVTVGLIWEGKIFRTYKAELKDGLVELHDLPLDSPFIPVVTVTHAGHAEQTLGAEPMSKYLPAAEIDMKVYELTTQRPEWTLGIREVIVAPVVINGELNLKVTEQLGGYNPLDRAWVGEKLDALGDAPVTVAITLPADAQNVVFGPGMLEAGARVVDGKVVRGGTMLPGSTAYAFQYVVPAKDGKASLAFVAPTKTSLFAMYVPESMKIEKATGLEIKKAGGANGDAAQQLLVAKAIKSGDSVAVELSGIKPPPPPATLPTLPGGDLNLPRPQTPPGTTGKESK